MSNETITIVRGGVPHTVALPAKSLEGRQRMRRKAAVRHAFMEAAPARRPR